MGCNTDIILSEKFEENLDKTFIKYIQGFRPPNVGNFVHDALC